MQNKITLTSAFLVSHNNRNISVWLLLSFKLSKTQALYSTRLGLGLVGGPNFYLKLRNFSFRKKN